jgi:LAS superfamily LD-carboxypeptidase LdcB
MNERELTGRARTHVVQRDDLRAAIHHDALDAFLALRSAASDAGFALSIFSSFRDFDAQRAIWNRKFRGERPLYARDGTQLDYAALSQPALLDAILAWSALPGASRHHWGTDLDVYDAQAMPPGYRVQLLPHEYATGGIFGALNRWLDANLAGFGFYRPYDADRGGVLPEPWHVSYAPIAVHAATQLTPELIEAALRDADLLGLDLVLERLPELYRRYVANVAAAPSGMA